MPRRQTTVERDIPLLLVPPMIAKRIRKYGGGMERIIVRRTWRHFYNISIRTTPVKRELKPMAARNTSSEAPVVEEEDEGS